MAGGIDQKGGKKEVKREGWREGKNGKGKDKAKREN